MSLTKTYSIDKIYNLSHASAVVGTCENNKNKEINMFL